MKPHLLFFLLLLSSIRADAQDWAPLHSSARRYFTNENGYLRGMRIDSVRAAAGHLIYYPFRSPRGQMNWLSGTTTLDSNGGSWLGKVVRAYPDGRWLFDTWLADTVEIQTRAPLNTPWIFYSDTTSRYYEATTIAIDTATVLGQTDSIRRILIRARNQTAYLPGDSLDGLEVMIGKMSGFVKVPDLYMWPYHKPAQGYDLYVDYFMYRAMTYYQSFQPEGMVFDLIPYQPPLQTTIYDFEAGDVFADTYTSPSIVPSSFNPIKRLDSVLSKAIVANGVQYTIKQRSWWRLQNSPPSPGWYFGSYTYTHTYPATPFFDTVRMPEEYKKDTTFWYFPNDSSYCTHATLWQTNVGMLIGNQIKTGLVYPILSKYKAGLGMTYTYQGGSAIPESKTLDYVHKSPIVCGTVDLSPLRIKDEIAAPTAAVVHPNPASHTLYFSTQENDTLRIHLYSPLGQRLKSESILRGRDARISVADLPAGTYFYTIIGVKTGHTSSGSVVILR